MASSGALAAAPAAALRAARLRSATAKRGLQVRPLRAFWEQRSDFDLSSMTAGLGDATDQAVILFDRAVDAGPSASFANLENVIETLSDNQRIVALIVLYGFITPGPFAGFVDYFLLGPIDTLLQRRFKTADFTLGNKIGSGNFGDVYQATLESRGPFGSSGSDKQVVLKKAKRDGAGPARADFLLRGTIARGSSETGVAEAYMNQRLMRTARSRIASYLGLLAVDKGDGPFTAGTQWLVWSYESDATLGDFLAGAQFPDGLDEYLFGKNRRKGSRAQRTNKVAKRVMRQLFACLADIHSTGVVHRDVKPENLLIDRDGQVRLIDLGAATDLRVGINFNPAFGLLDPDYCPPEEYVMPQNVPAPPVPLLAAALCPFIWQATSPDRFDTFSAGVILLQMALPSIRPPAALKAFRRELAARDWDLESWRKESPTAARADFEALDADLGAGWDLAKRLVCRRNGLLRGRLSASAALLHPYLTVTQG